MAQAALGTVLVLPLRGSVANDEKHKLQAGDLGKLARTNARSTTFYIIFKQTTVYTIFKQTIWGKVCKLEGMLDPLVFN